MLLALLIAAISTEASTLCAANEKVQAGSCDHVRTQVRVTRRGMSRLREIRPATAHRILEPMEPGSK